MTGGAGERRALARDYLGALSFDGARLEFCERFDERSEVWNLTKHQHPFFELIYVVEGRANISAGGDTVGIGGLDCVVYPPGLMHLEHLEIDRRQEIICLWVDVGPTPAFDHPIAVPDVHGTLRQVFELVWSEYAAARPRREALISHYLSVLLLHLQQVLEEPAREGASVLERALAHLHEHYAEDLSVEQLAALVAVSPSHLHRLFREGVGLAPMHYRNRIRVERARLMLLDEALPIDRVAERVGFTDGKYFARAFKQATGMSPSAYRRQRVSDVSR